MPTTASQVRPASTAALNTRNLGQKPNKGGIPARLNMNTAKASARAGRVRDMPDIDAIVSTGRPASSRIRSTQMKLPRVITT